MEGIKIDAETRESFLFLHLLNSFENAALIGLGKLPDPNGECKVELESASFAIDMLDMIKTRTRGNLKDEEEQYLERVISNLKLNYLADKEKGEETREKGKEKTENGEIKKT